VKREIKKSQLIHLLNNLDKRSLELSNESIDEIINNAFAELSTVARLFTDEDVLSTRDYYDNGELIFTLDIHSDVVYVYDLYLTVENQDHNIFDHGINKITDLNCIYRDNRESGRIHVDLTKVPENQIIDNIVIKYFYTPSATDNSIYMDQPTYVATRNALGVALYDWMNDVDRSMQKLAAMKRTGLAAVPNDPEDLLEPKPSMFPRGV